MTNVVLAAGEEFYLDAADVGKALTEAGCQSQHVEKLLNTYLSTTRDIELKFPLPLEDGTFMVAVAAPGAEAVEVQAGADDDGNEITRVLLKPLWERVAGPVSKDEASSA